MFSVFIERCVSVSNFSYAYFVFRSFARHLSGEAFLIRQNSLYYTDVSPLLSELHIFLAVCPFFNLTFLCAVSKCCIFMYTNV